jgi:hypothetical protein
MSLILGDRIRQTSTTTGSGTLTLDGTVTGFQSFSAVGEGNTTYYTIALDSQWEVGIGTYSAGTLSRDTVLSSSTGSKIVFAVGAKDVFVTLPSEKAVTSGTDAVLTKLTTPTVQATNSAGLSLKNSAGTTQISMGGGGGDNVSVNVSTNMNGSNAQIDISPTGTGHVHMKPSGTGSIEIAPINVGTIDNMTIGVTTPKAVTGTTITATSFSGSGSGLTSIPNSALTNSSITINGASTSLGGSVNVGTVTSASVVSANGFAGTVATDTTTPAITLSTSITGVLKGNGTAISAASAGTDYQAPITLTTTGTSGAATFIANTLNIPQYSGGGGGSGTVTSVDATVPAFLSVTGGPITTSGTLAISYSGTALPIANGGTGATTQQAAINALAGSVQNSRFLAGNGTNVTMRTIAVGDVPTLNQNTTGTSANVTGTVAVANGGTGTTTPSLVAGENITLSGSWPNQTVNSTYTGFKNRLINGQMQIAQRATSGTSGNAAPTTTPTYPSVDRWYAYATGATVTVAQVAGSEAIKNNLQVTGAASVTAIGVGQRIEQFNCYDLAGSTATLSVNISNSLLTTVTWTASYATSADTWSAKTQIATGTFTVTSTLTNYNAQISIPSAATTGIEILFTVGAQTSGTWVIGNAQLEKGGVATSFDYRAFNSELFLCQRYCQYAGGAATGSFDNSTTTIQIVEKCIVPMRAVPSASRFPSATITVRNQGSDKAAATPVLANYSANISDYGQLSFWVQVSGFTGGVSNTVVTNRNTATINGGSFILLSAEL